MNYELTKPAASELAKYGIVITFTDDGLIELTSRRGVKCTYSSRGYSPVIGFGVDGRIMVRLIGNEIAQLRINGKQFDYCRNDPSLRIAVPK
jgi:hypothetical protein